jgi:hypothetical protein
MTALRKLSAWLSAAVIAVSACAAHAQLTTTHAGRGGSHGAAFAATWRGHAGQNTTLSAYTFTAEPIGTAEADRIVIVAIASSSAASQQVSTGTPVTIGGVAATQVVMTGLSTRSVEIWEANVPLGTTADIVITYTGAMSHSVIDWWTVTGTTQTTFAGLSASTSSTFTGGSLTLPSFTVPAGGAAFAMAFNTDTSVVTPFTWSQTSGSGTIRTNGLQGTGFNLSTYDTTASGAQAFTATAGSSFAYRGAAISWGP